MLTISLTSIPPRFSTLRGVTESLLRQTIPARVVVNLPKTYRRFPGPVGPPVLPDGVIVRRLEADFGPATKLLGCLDDPDATDILYCDDDWDYAPDWAATLLSARANQDEAVAASVFSISRLKRSAKAPFDTVAQGFGGVLVRKNLFDAQVWQLPEAAFAADDIWLSGCLAARHIPVCRSPEARALCTAIQVPGPQLQDVEVDGHSRRDANAACVDAVHNCFGIWPKQN